MAYIDPLGLCGKSPYEQYMEETRTYITAWDGKTTEERLLETYDFFKGSFYEAEARANLFQYYLNNSQFLKAMRYMDPAMMELIMSAGMSGFKILTPYGNAIQSSTSSAKTALQQVQNGATVYKGGVFSPKPSEITASQFLSLESPLNPDYASRYGIPSQNANFEFILTGQLKTGAAVITRPAPGIPPNLGGGIEAVTTPGALKINSFYMP